VDTVGGCRGEGAWGCLAAPGVGWLAVASRASLPAACSRVGWAVAGSSAASPRASGWPGGRRLNRRVAGVCRPGRSRQSRCRPKAPRASPSHPASGPRRNPAGGWSVGSARRQACPTGGPNHLQTPRHAQEAGRMDRSRQGVRQEAGRGWRVAIPETAPAVRMVARMARCRRKGLVPYSCRA
jgi:hypothetical protein